jgi:hypothetical protein
MPAATHHPFDKPPVLKLSYRPPRLTRLGTIQSFILGGVTPVGNDLALPEEDGATS